MEAAAAAAKVGPAYSISDPNFLFRGIRDRTGQHVVLPRNGPAACCVVVVALHYLHVLRMLSSTCVVIHCVGGLPSDPQAAIPAWLVLSGPRSPLLRCFPRGR